MSNPLLSLLGNFVPGLAAPAPAQTPKAEVKAETSSPVLANSERPTVAKDLAQAPSMQTPATAQAAQQPENLLDQTISLLENIGLPKKIVETVLKNLGLIKASDVQAQVENQVKALVENQVKAAAETAKVVPTASLPPAAAASVAKTEDNLATVA